MTTTVSVTHYSPTLRSISLRNTALAFFPPLPYTCPLLRRCFSQILKDVLQSLVIISFPYLVTLPQVRIDKEKILVGSCGIFGTILHILSKCFRDDVSFSEYFIRSLCFGGVAVAVTQARVEQIMFGCQVDKEPRVCCPENSAREISGALCFQVITPQALASASLAQVN